MIEIIPAIDLMNGRCVRLSQGDFGRKTTYGDDPAVVAKSFEEQGCRRLHMVDLDGARRGAIANLDVLERVAAATDLKIDFGGGIKNRSDIRSVFDAGAAIATVGSVAVKEPGTFFDWIGDFGGERILLGADVRGRKLAINGWLTETDVDVVDFLKNCVERGAKGAFVTDIERDGLLGGPATGLYREILAGIPELDLIASGGVASKKDLEDLEAIGCRAAIVGKALYEGRGLNELR
jgi:phosphoribosylformimino-5-aminoimidazole carboxamide ribotide isomerase